MSSQQIGYNTKSNVRTFNFDPDNRPCLVVKPDENISDLENVPAIRRVK